MKNNYKSTTNQVASTGWLFKFWLFLMLSFASGLQAQVVTTISPANSNLISGSVNAAGTKNNGDMITINTTANRGWCVFSLASIPPGSTITAVTAEFTTFSSASSTAVNNVKVFSGNPVTDAGATVYTNIGAIAAGTVANSSSWTANALQSKVFTAAGIAACQAAIGSSINIAYVRASTNTYNIFGYTASATNQPKLIITYTPPVIANDLSLINPSTPNGTLCTGASSTTVSVTLRNNGTALADFSINPATITASVTGPNGTTFAPVVINSGTLAAGATQVVTIATGYNASLSGTYNFSSSVAWTPDGFNGNNNLAFSATSAYSVVASSNTYTFCDGTLPQLNTAAFAQYQVLSIPFAPDASVLNQSGAALGDEGNIDVPLPFTFTFNGVPYTGVTIHANGQILMGTGNATANNIYSPPTIFSNAAPNNWVGFWSDLNVTVAGSITYDIVGSAPNRKFIARFTNVPFFSATPFVTYQIELNETSNVIDVFLTSVNGVTNTKAIGLETATYGVAAPGRNSGTWTATNEGWRFALPTITYAWSPTAGLSNPNIANPVATLASGASQIYTVTVTNSVSGCVVTDTVSLTNLGGGDPAPTTTGASACAGAPATLSASGLSTLRWYTAPVGGTLVFTGPTWNNTWASTTTFYVESFNGVCPSARTPVTITVTPQPVITPTATPSSFCLGSTTQLAANNYVSGNLQTAVLGGNGASGNAFNISNINGTSPIRIDSVYMGIASGTLAEVWYIPGGYGCAVLSSSAGWTLAGSVAITAAGASPNLTSIPLNLNITIPVGQTYGFVVVCNGSNYYTNGTTVCAPLLADGNISISQGHGGGGMGGAFSFPNNPRNFNGRVFYSFGDPNLTFNWTQTAGTGSISNPAIANPTATPTSSGTNTYQLIAVNAANCSTTVAVSATANALPLDVNTLGSTTVFCGCGVAVLTANLPTPGSNVRWYTVATGGTAIGTGTPFNAPSACGVQTYYAEAFDPISGCVQAGPRASFTFTPLTSPSVSISATDLNICDGDPASTLTATSPNDPNYTYSWTPTSGLTPASGLGAIVSALPAVTTTYTVTANDAGTGCQAQATVLIGRGATPIISGASAAPSAYCTGGSSQLSVSAYASGGGGPAPTTYGASAATSTADDEIFNVTFGTLNNTSDCFTTGGGASALNLYSDYTALPAPTVISGQVVPFSVTVAYCSGFAYGMQFIIYIDWNRDGDFLDLGEAAFTSTAATAAVTGTAYPGSITIPSSASAGQTRMRVVLVEGTVPGPTGSYTWGETEDYTINVLSATGLTYAWTPPGNLNNASISNPIANPAVTTNYTVVVTDPGGCSASTQVPVTVSAPPSAPSVTNGTHCGPGTVNLSATGTNIFWVDTIGGPILTTGNNYSPSITSTQTYYVIENPGSSTSNVGLAHNAPGTTAFASATANYQTFNVISPSGIIINTVDIVPNILTPLGTAVSIQLEDAAGNALGAPVSTVTTTQGTVQTITLNMFVPQGTAYRLRPVSNPNLQYHQNGFANPYTLPGQVSITGWGPPNATTLYVFFYNWSVSTACYSAPSIATGTITPAPALVINPAGPTSYCNSGSVILDASILSDPSYVNFNWSPATGLNVAVGPVVVASPSVTTTYTLTADDGVPNGCSSTATVTITVNSGPTVSIAPAPFDSLCSGASFLINATAGSSSFKQVGSGTNSANNTIAIYDGVNANIKTQVLYTAAELNAAGLIGPGNITSAAFNVVNKLSSTPLSGFTMRMASVATAPPLTATYLSPVFTTVFTGNVSTVLGWNQHVFTTPFFWDGTSNVILEVCNGTPGAPGFDQVQNTPTATAQTIIGNALGCASLTGAVNLNRPNTRFTGGAVNYSWAPAGELSAANIEDPTYTATSDGAKSLVLTVTDPANGCTATATLNFTISGTPKAPSIATSSSTAICNSATVTVVASGTTGSYQWQSSPDNATWTDIGGQTTATLNQLISVDTYIRVKASCANDAFSNSIFFDVTAPALPVGTGASVCGQGNVSLSATVTPGLYDVWYDAPTGGNFIQIGSPLNVFVNTTTTYYVAASVAPIPAPGPAPTGYLPSTASSTADEEISNVTFGAINNSSTCLTTGGPGSVLNLYSDYTALAPVTFAPGQSVPYSVTQTTCGGAFSNRTAIFIDYNRDGDFDDAGENPVLSPVVVGNNTASGSIIIPLTASVGFTRMRVINVETTGTITPTGTYTWGETEDYILQIGSTVCQSARVPVVATVTPAPPLTISPASATICQGDSILLSDPTGNYAGGYSWDNGLTIINASNASTYAKPSTTTSYILTGTGSGCANADTVVVTVNPAPVFTLSTTTPSVCGGGTASISANVTSPVAGNYTLTTVAYAPQVPTGTPVILADAGVAVTPQTITSLDDGTWEGLPLPAGFAFSYYGSTPTQFNVSTNGFMTFGATLGSASCCSGQLLPNAFTPNDYLALAHEDWLLGVSGKIDYFTNGVAPNRVFVVRFTNCPRFSGTGAPTTGQIELYETTNVIEYHVGSVTTAAGDATTMAIEDGTGANFVVVSGRNSTSPWTATNEGWRFQVPAAATISWTGPNITSATNIPTITAQPAASAYYVCTVTNPTTGCTKTDSIQILASANPQPFLTRNGAALTPLTLCNPDTIIIRVSDPTYPSGYPAGTTFEWVGITPAIVGLDSISSNNGSSYQVIVTLPTSCFGTSSAVSITTKSVAIVPVIVPASCITPGSISVTVGGTGASPDYNYVWSTDFLQTNIIRNVTKTNNQDTILNLAAGTYYLQVYDQAGTLTSCNSGIIPIVVTGTAPINITSVAGTNINCFGNQNGSATANWTGGGAPYTVSWSDGFVSTGVLVNSSTRGFSLPGTFTVTVSDGNGCSNTSSVVITEPAPVTVALTSTPTSGANGTVTAVASGGNGVFTYLWADEFSVVIGAGNPLTGLAAGLYYCLATDSNGCDNIATLSSDSIRVDSLNNATFNITAFIEGYFDGVGLVPALFNTGVSVIPTECDTIRVELRDQLTPANVLASGIAVLNTSGQASFTFPGTVIGANGYIAVFHRNAVETWSPVMTFAGVNNYNFTTAATQAEGSNQREVLPGIWAFYSGDLSPQDGTVDILDQGVIDNDIFNFASGYVVSDITGDNTVDIIDQGIVDNNIFNFVGTIHP